MSVERYVTISEVKELLQKEHDERAKQQGLVAQPAVEFKSPEEMEVMPVEEDTVFKKKVLTDAMAHAEATSKISKGDADKLVNDLLGLKFGDENILLSLRDNGLAFKIADILPKYPEDIRAIFSKERVKLEADDISKIIDTVKKYQ